MAWQQLAEQSSTHRITPNTYVGLRGECGVLRQLSSPENAVQFDMDAPADCPKGSSGRLEARYVFSDYPTGFGSPRTVIRPRINVRALGNNPIGFGTLGVLSYLDQGDDSGWEWLYDPSSGDDGVVEIGDTLEFHQPGVLPYRYSFSGSTGDDYVLYGFVIDLTWQVLVPAPPA
jgi:hypothetical protein